MPFDGPRYQVEPPPMSAQALELPDPEGEPGLLLDEPLLRLDRPEPDEELF